MAECRRDGRWKDIKQRNYRTVMASQMKIERMIHGEGSGVNFGAYISHVDLENASGKKGLEQQ